MSHQGAWNVAMSQGVLLRLKAARSATSHLYCSLPSFQSAYDPSIRMWAPAAAAGALLRKIVSNAIALISGHIPLLAAQIAVCHYRNKAVFTRYTDSRKGARLQGFVSLPKRLDTAPGRSKE